MKMFVLFFVTGFSGPAFLSAESYSAPASVVVPTVEFSDTPISDAVEFLVQRSRELDIAESDSQKKGINAVLLGDFEDTRLTLRVSDVPLGVILSLVAELADAKLEIAPEVVMINRGNSYEAVKRRSGGEPLEAKLRKIMIPSVDFQGTPLKDALDFLAQRSVELDMGPEGETKGINAVLKSDQPVAVSLRLHSVSLYTALEMTVRVAGYEMEIREHLVFVSPAGGQLKKPVKLPLRAPKTSQ
ncbi:hypothetical protein N9B73_10130 [Verrucomicrobiales bacterium]|nr:hypothetical protein [Verrucomicrobiales bacterium]